MILTTRSGNASRMGTDQGGIPASLPPSAAPAKRPRQGRARPFGDRQSGRVRAANDGDIVGSEERGRAGDVMHLSYFE
jgi:hypothetical protein